MTALRWSRAATDAVALGAVLRWARAGADGPAPVTPRLRVARASADGAAAVVVKVMANLADVEPETTVTLTASLTSQQPADAWTWRRISGPVIGINGTGPTVSFTAPSVLAGTTLTLGVTATVGGTASAERTFTVAVLPQTEWWWTGTGWVPHLELWTVPLTLVLTTVTPNV